MATTIQITNEFIKEYLPPKGKRHHFYSESKTDAFNIKVHAEGCFPEVLVGERRPTESEYIQRYRKSIFKSKTIGAFGKIINELMKIRKSEDWLISYNDKKFISTRDGESIYDYCEKNFPRDFQSVTNWVFSVLLEQYIIDPNAVVLVMPINDPVEQSEVSPEYPAQNDSSQYLRPFPVIFNSEQVFDFVDENYCVLYAMEKAEYGRGKSLRRDGHIIYVVTDMTIQKWVQIDAKGNMALSVSYDHGIGDMPAFKIGAAYKKSIASDYLYKSRISTAIPSFDEAVREYSDLQAEVVQHIHSLMWSFSNQVCQKCQNGKIAIKVQGKEVGDEGSVRWVDCDTCKGTGYSPFNPYEHLTLRPQSNSEQPMPTPFIGYVTKDTAIVKIQDERVRSHIYDALSSINMEYLAQVPLSQSGVAKEVDRSSLNTYVASIAEDIVNVMDKVYFFINEERYIAIELNEDKRQEQLPRIAVPQMFDLLDSSYVMDELKTAKDAGANDAVIAALEIDYANAKFSNNDIVRNELLFTYELDPFPCTSEEDKMARLQNGGITREDYVMSCNITQFIRRAIKEVDGIENFIALDYEARVAMMKKYTDEVLGKNLASRQLEIKLSAEEEAAKNPPVPEDEGETEEDGEGGEDGEGKEDEEK